MNAPIHKLPHLIRPLTLVAANARILMGQDEPALTRLWRRKRGEVVPDGPEELVLQFAKATEAINRTVFERQTGKRVVEGARRFRHPVLKWMGAVLDGRLEDDGLFEAEFWPSGPLTPQIAGALFHPSVQHNLWAAQAKRAELSVLTGDGRWVHTTLYADPLYQHLLITAEKRFRRSVESGEAPSLFLLHPDPLPPPMLPIVDMNESEAWRQAAVRFHATLAAFDEHRHTREALENLMPVDAYRVFGVGVAVQRAPLGALRFEAFAEGGVHA